MARPDPTRDPDEYDDPDVNIGDYVYARDMKHATPLGTNEVLLYYPETVFRTGPVWVQGWFKEADGNLSGMWWTAFGNLGTPAAWAPLPKTKGDL